MPNMECVSPPNRLRATAHGKSVSAISVRYMRTKESNYYSKHFTDLRISLLSVFLGQSSIARFRRTTGSAFRLYKLPASNFAGDIKTTTLDRYLRKSTSWLCPVFGTKTR